LRTQTHAIRTVVYKDKPVEEDTWWKALTYAEYLKTKHWRQIKRGFFLWLKHRSEDKKLRCNRCSKKMTKSNRKQFAVHHKNYESMGYESMKHLELLCKRCHEMEHH
jgi:hypothetical protein